MKKFFKKLWNFFFGEPSGTIYMSSDEFNSLPEERKQELVLSETEHVVIELDGIPTITESPLPPFPAFSPDYIKGCEDYISKSKEIKSNEDLPSVQQIKDELDEINDKFVKKLLVEKPKEIKLDEVKAEKVKSKRKPRKKKNHDK